MQPWRCGHESFLVRARGDRDDLGALRRRRGLLRLVIRMTNQERAAQFDVINPTLEHLSGYMGGSTLQPVVERGGPSRDGSRIGTQRRYDPDERRLMRIRRAAGQSFSTIATDLHVPLGTVKRICGR